MDWFKKKTSTDSDNNTVTSLVAQDPGTRVKTTSAATVTTNTAVQNATIVDQNKNTITFQTTRQTVTHTQQARVTEVHSKQGPFTMAELNKFFDPVNLNGNSGTTSKARSSTFNKTGSSSTTTTSLLPPLKFQNRVGGRDSTLLKVEEISVRQDDGRRVTQHEESHHVKVKPIWNPNSTYGTPSITGTGTKSVPGPTKAKSKPTVTAPTTIGQPYISPYRSTAQSTPSKTIPPYNLRSTSTTKQSKSDANIISPPSQPIAATPYKQSPSVSKNKLKPAKVYIFNHESFSKETKNEYREGSAKDVENLKRTFRLFRCKTEVIKDATVAQVTGIVNQLSKFDFKNYSALVIVILSHGHRYDKIAARDGTYSIDDDVLFPLLNNLKLNDKPKLFFVQACKGDKEVGALSKDSTRPIGSPNEIMKCYSSFEGYVSYRLEDGSPFIQTLCEHLRLRGNIDDISKIMDKVRIAVKQQTQDRQIPSVTSTLTKNYIFGDYVQNG